MIDKKEHDILLKREQKKWIPKKKNFTFVAIFLLCIAVVSTIVFNIINLNKILPEDLKVIKIFLWSFCVFLPLVCALFFGMFILVAVANENIRSFEIMKQPIFCEKCKNELMEFDSCEIEKGNLKNKYFAIYKCKKCGNVIHKKVKELDYKSWLEEEKIR